jgi:DNA anti-recombination protein RmuC
VADEEFAVTKNELERTAAGKRHMESIKGHIKGLSGKNYQSLYGFNSLDFVLLFVPIEPAFMLAVAHPWRQARKSNMQETTWMSLRNRCASTLRRGRRSIFA